MKFIVCSKRCKEELMQSRAEGDGEQETRFVSTTVGTLNGVEAIVRFNKFCVNPQMDNFWKSLQKYNVFSEIRYL